MSGLRLTRLVARSIERALQDGRNARFLGELAVREGLRRIVSPASPPGRFRPTAENGTSRRPSVPPSASIGLDEPLPGYDLMSAAQVIDLLAGMEAGEREAVRAYEETHRARRAILDAVRS